MNRLLERIKALTGLDRAIAYSVSARGLGVIMQPIRLVGSESAIFLSRM